MKEKVCPKCSISKPLNDFGMRSGKSSHLTISYCKSCISNYTAEWNNNNKENISVYRKRWYYKKHYNLTLEQYDELVKDGCNICGSYESLCIDHDHSCCPGKESCGKCIRGVLCMRHNIALGQVDDSIKELNALIDYLTNASTIVRMIK